MPACCAAARFCDRCSLPLLQGPDPIYDGNVPDSQIAQQITVLNSVYQPMGLTFQLMGTTRTENASWFTSMTSGSANEAAAQQLLHVGGLNTVSLGLMQCRAHICCKPVLC